MYTIEPMTSKHGRKAFCSGIDSLDSYLKRQASQDMARYVAMVFVAVEAGSADVAGYFTLSASSINPGELPPDLARKLPRYQNLPATLIGRLAVDQSHQGKNLGRALLTNALRRSWESSFQIASMAVIVDAINSRARDFYLHYGFEDLPDNPRRLLMLTSSMGRLFGS